MPYQSLANVLSLSEPRAVAIAALREAARTYPARTEFHWHLADMLRADGDLHGAIAGYKEGLRAWPTNAFVHDAIAQILAIGPDRVRDGKQAVEHATKACELSDWKDARNIETLAAAHAEAGDFGKAVEYQNKALAFSNDDEQLAKVRERLDLYVPKNPYPDAALARRELPPPPRAVK